MEILPLDRTLRERAAGRRRPAADDRTDPALARCVSTLGTGYAGLRRLSLRATVTGIRRHAGSALPGSPIAGTSIGRTEEPLGQCRSPAAAVLWICAETEQRFW